jgi:predicted nuclease of predicted toxin-antitoxin system
LSVRFLVDAQLPPDLARFLREQGQQASAAREVGLRNAEDSTIWDYALREQCVIITKDEDFAQRALATQQPAPVVIWLRVGNCSNRALRQWFAPLYPKVLAAIERGERFLELV